MMAKKTVLVILSIAVLIALIGFFRGGQVDLSDKYMKTQNLDEDIDGLLEKTPIANI